MITKHIYKAFDLTFEVLNDWKVGLKLAFLFIFVYFSKISRLVFFLFFIIIIFFFCFVSKIYTFDWQ